jgi:hypothetical protein
MAGFKVKVTIGFMALRTCPAPWRQIAQKPIRRLYGSAASDHVVVTAIGKMR